MGGITRGCTTSYPYGRCGNAVFSLRKRLHHILFLDQLAPISDNIRWSNWSKNRPRTYVDDFVWCHVVDSVCEPSDHSWSLESRCMDETPILNERFDKYRGCRELRRDTWSTIHLGGQSRVRVSCSGKSVVAYNHGAFVLVCSVCIRVRTLFSFSTWLHLFQTISDNSKWFI